MRATKVHGSSSAESAGKTPGTISKFHYQQIAHSTECPFIL
jgi:hypothetical protein